MIDLLFVRAGGYRCRCGPLAWREVERILADSNTTCRVYSFYWSQTLSASHPDNDYHAEVDANPNENQLLQLQYSYGISAVVAYNRDTATPPADGYDKPESISRLHKRAFASYCQL